MAEGPMCEASMPEGPMAHRSGAAGRAACAPAVRVGVDVTAIEDVADAVAHFGDRYVRRIFTPHEIDSCVGHGATASLAARFAAKEAVVKVLEPDGARPPWLDIEIVRRPEGGCRVRLHRSAASLAAERGVGQMSVSLSHEAGVAVAVVAAANAASVQRGATPLCVVDQVPTQQPDTRGAQR